MKKLAAIILLSLTGFVFAQNTPCSGKKGGIDHCENGKFICKDGSVSGSKKICSGHGNSTKASSKKTNKQSNSNNSGAGSAFNPDAS